MTLHPTFAVSDDVEPRIEVTNVPAVSGAVSLAHELGLRVRLEPHLDWAGAYEWRRRMYVNPVRQYFDEVLAPLSLTAPDELTLGSELDVSAYEFAGEWLECARRLRLTGIALGHKLNHDWQSAQDGIRREGNAERSRRGLPGRWGFGYGRELERYLSELDYVAVSYYTPGELALPENYTIGEFGLGSTDVTRPWHFDASTFRTPEDFAVRRSFYLRFLNWLGTRQSPRAACFWTAGHFDVLGVMNPDWRDHAVVEAVIAHNRQASP